MFVTVDHWLRPEVHMAKKGKRGIRYTKEKKAEILAAAKKEGLTGAQVKKRFGVSTLTFYRWRGPVRSDAVARRGKRGPGPAPRTGKVHVDPGMVRKAVREQVQKLLPLIIREEIEAALR
jgi:transposase-like protein